MIDLDATQRQAVESEENTIIIAGGPGTGKTFLITRRFEHVVGSMGIPASSILVLTFSGASCARLRRSIQEMLSRSYDELWIHTYYSFAHRVLSEYASISTSAAEASSITPFREYLLVKEMLRMQKHSFKSHMRSKVFHRVSCPHAKEITARNLLTFSTVTEATKFGRRKCGVCFAE